MLTAPGSGDNWLGLARDRLPIADALAWATTEATGGQVMFTGTVRDHADGRTGVERLEYEAYEEHAVARLEAVAAEVRARWPDVVRLVMLHRVGVLELRDTAVVVVVSAPHRAEAFAAARFGIDSLKATVPIWKKEHWAGGAAWASGAQAISEVVRP